MAISAQPATAAIKQLAIEKGDSVSVFGGGQPHYYFNEKTRAAEAYYVGFKPTANENETTLPDLSDLSHIGFIAAHHLFKAGGAF